MLKSFNEMRKVDVSPYLEEREGFKYLNWATCIMLLRENGAEEVWWQPVENPATGNSLRCSEKAFADKNGVANQCYETKIEVHVDDKVFYMQSPVLNGVNPVKDNSMSQLRLHNSMCRSFVKCIAIRTGLGFDLWLKEEFDNNHAQIPDTLDDPASPTKIKLLQNLCAGRLKLDLWLQKLGKNLEQLTEREVSEMLLAVKKKYGVEE
jgi:hypothetical protein